MRTFFRLEAGGRLYCSKAGEPSKCFLSKEDSSEYYVEFAGSGSENVLVNIF